MAWAFVASTYGPYTGSTSGTTLDAAATLNIAQNDLLVAIGRYYESSDEGRVITFAENDGDNSFTMIDRVVSTSGTRFARAGYVVVVNANETATIRMTLDGAVAYRSFIVMQFRPDAGETVTYDAGGAPAAGYDTTPLSGNISTTGTDELVVGLFGGGADKDITDTMQIADASATGSQGGDAIATPYTAGWYKVFTETQTDIHAQAYYDIQGSGYWTMNCLAFKSEAVAGGSVVPIVMNYYRRLRS